MYKDGRIDLKCPEINRIKRSY